MSKSTPPRTDVGTIILHWLTAIAFAVSLFTGMRIAADALNAPVSRWLSPVLPEGEIWTWHYLAGFFLLLSMVTYAVYLNRSGLAARNTLQKLRLFTMPIAGKKRLEPANVLLHWSAYAIILTSAATGVVLYVGFGGWWVWVHSTTAFVGGAWVLFHVLTHFLQGGWPQLLRLFRPAKLIVTRAVKPMPLLAAFIAGTAGVAAVAGLDWSSRDTLVVARSESAPVLDGDLGDAAWSKAVPIRIRTQQGSNFQHDSGETTVEVRAIHDRSKIYFAFKWDDPTRSLRRIPLVKKDNGWHVADDRADQMDVVDFYEDKLAVIFSDKPALGGAGVSSLGSNPLPGKPAPLNERGFHFTSDGSYVDMWQWKATRGGLMGFVDDQYIGPPYEPSEAEKAYTARYQGGYWNDPGRAFYSYNYKPLRKGHEGPVEVLRLPKDWRATVTQLGKFDLEPKSNDDEAARWSMFEEETEPYSPEADALIPVGTVMPGVIISGKYEGDRANVAGGARWRDGQWILETARSIMSESKFDKSFSTDKALYMWVAAFDHVQTRHTRHTRPIRIQFQP